MSEVLPKEGWGEEDYIPDLGWSMDMAEAAVRLSLTADEILPQSRMGKANEAERLKQARQRDVDLVSIIQTYQGHPTIYMRSHQYFEPRDPDKLSLDSEHRLDQELAQYRLLSKSQERTLFKKLDKAVELYAQLGGATPSGKEEEAFLEATAAYHILITSNLRLVRSLAIRKVATRQSLTLTDLINEGSAGLGKAIRRFDSSRELVLSTSATYWIKQAIARAIEDKDQMIRLPVWVATALNRYVQVKSTKLGELGRDPTYEEVAEAFGGDLSREDHDEYERIQTLTPDYLSRLMYAEGDDVELKDKVPDPDAHMPDEVIHNHDVLRRLIGYARLSERECDVLIMHYGLGETEDYDLAEIGRRIGLSRERVRQIHASAMVKLQGAARQHGLEFN